VLTVAQYLLMNLLDEEKCAVWIGASLDAEVGEICCLD